MMALLHSMVTPVVPTTTTTTATTAPNSLGEDIGNWAFFRSANTSGDLVGYWTVATSSSHVYDWQLKPSLYLRCVVGSAEGSAFIGTPWLFFNDFDTESMDVEYRFNTQSGPIRTTGWSNEESGSTVFIDDIALRADASKLYVSLWDDHSNKSMTFDVSGMSRVMNALDCW